MTGAISLPPQSAAAERCWHLLFELHERMPAYWTLVGGQMVILHCVARGTVPVRATEDLDAALDVRLRPGILREFTGALTELGFASAGRSPGGHQHRWVTSDGAQVDVLIARHLGPRAEGRTGATGGTTIASPAVQQALDRSEPVDVVVAGRSGTVNLPSLHAALVAKSAAYGVVLDRQRERHLTDLCALLAVVARGDGLEDSSRRDLEHLGNAFGALRRRPDIVARVDGAAAGLLRARELTRFAAMRLDRGARGGP